MALQAGSHPWLAPLGALFGAGAALRVALYRGGVLRRSRLAGPVISVGNLAVGGSGKTPIVARVAALLRDEGLPVAILSRGYRGDFRGECLVVSDGEQVLADAALAGDEPVMLARDLPGVVVAVGPRRDRVGLEVEARFGRRVHVLDDGFQHVRLARDLDLLCLDAADLADRPLPAGRLREWPRSAARAQVLLVPEGDPAPILLASGQKVLRVRRRVLGFFDRGGIRCDPPKRPYLLSGIARPERFAADVRAEAGTLAGHDAFPDHHAFLGSDVEQVTTRARTANADALVTTAKDAVRLPRMEADLPILVLRIAAELDDEAAFRQLLKDAARSAA